MPFSTPAEQNYILHIEFDVRFPTSNFDVRNENESS